MHTLLIKEGTDQSNKFFQTFSACKCRRMELLVKQCSVGYNEVIQSGNRSCCCGWSLNILSCRWRNAISYRCMCVTSIRCSSCLSTKRYVCRYRIESGLIMTTTWIHIFLQWAAVCISNISCKIIHIIDCITKLRNFVNHMMDLCKSAKLLFGRFQSHNSLKNRLCSVSIYCHACVLHSLKDHFRHIRNGLLIQTLVIVPCQSLFVLFHGDFLIFVYKLTDRI